MYVKKWHTIAVYLQLKIKRLLIWKQQHRGIGEGFAVVARVLSQGRPFHKASVGQAQPHKRAERDDGVVS